MFEELDDEMLAMLVEDLVWPETTNKTIEEKQLDGLPDEPNEQELAKSLKPIINLGNTTHEDLKQSTLSQQSTTQLSNSQNRDRPKEKATELQTRKDMPNLRVSLRQRNAIQLHPFTLEYAQYRKMISNSTTRKRRPFSISNAEYADSQLEDFLVGAQKEDSNQISESQYMPDSSVTQADSLPMSLERENDNLSEDEELDFDSKHFDKYHLEKLILPKAAAAADIANTSSQNKKMITFDKRKKKKVKNSSLSKRKAPSHDQDIFSFQHKPQASFDIATINRHNGQEKDIFAFPEDGDDYSYADAITEDEEEDEELHLTRTFRTKRRRIISDDSDEDEEKTDEQKSPESEIFKMPKKVKPNPRTLERKITDGDVVPIVQDEYEFKQPRRRRMDIHDVLKKKNALNGLLPASFVKTFEKDIREEGKKYSVSKPRPKSTTSKSTKPKSSGTKVRSTQDIFASFLDSQSESETTDTEDSPLSSLTRSTIPDIFSDHENEYDDSLQGLPTLSTRSPAKNKPLLTTSIPKALPKQKQSHPILPTNMSPSLSKKQPSGHNSLEESIEDNRIRTHYRQTLFKNNATSQKRRKQALKISSIAAKKPPNLLNYPMRTMHIQDNPAPHRRRKRPKRSRDDIYVHAPLFSRLWFDKSGQAPDNNSSVFFRNTGPVRRQAFDDIYVGTSFSTRYAYESLDLRLMLAETSGLEKSTNNPFDAGLHVIHSLESIAKRTRHLYDHDLRRIRGLTNTVYLHHRLLKPLLSATPNLKSAYVHLKQAFSEPLLFEKNIVWQNINFKNRNIIDYLFFKASRSLSDAFSQGAFTHLDKHDSFYIFVSICLTQWIPKFAYAERLRMTEVFLTHIRSLTWLSVHLVTTRPKPFLPFQIIIKLQLFCLDWTCRLHHLGVRPSDWSVTDCTQMLMDTLVYAGYEDIKSNVDEKHYLVEAWVCLIQIMSVSSQGAGYCFYERVFLEQLRSSIKRKARDSVPNEFGKRKTTRMWAETLNYILDKYMML
ncbi:hypothetical protein A0J61_01810 [Choanephora cucurbitarum]|uniref:Uncharacterized protein n=1 Tax=Choanephora cucurbitarum TaxID=101091 RepID=A0A1C7NMM2_9FUNG|nr:hypothetical protein A0J61_01810 [Choanephora cucurbitarum]